MLPHRAWKRSSSDVMSHIQCHVVSNYHLNICCSFYDKVRNMKLKQRILLLVLRKSHVWEKGLKALLGDARYQQIKDFFWHLYLR